MGEKSYIESENILSKNTKNLNRAILSLIEELEAINWYQQRVDAVEDKSLKKILAHNRDEEKEHAAMILEWIRRNDETFAKELQEYLFTEEREITDIEEDT
ncbi:MAG: ferritin [Thermodesulfobacteriota bacterium]|nr:ferritin [Thermodesulfobacteriota bacterium]